MQTYYVVTQGSEFYSLLSPVTTPQWIVEISEASKFHSYGTAFSVASLFKGSEVKEVTIDYTIKPVQFPLDFILQPLKEYHNIVFILQEDVWDIPEKIKGPNNHDLSIYSDIILQDIGDSNYRVIKNRVTGHININLVDAEYE